MPFSADPSMPSESGQRSSVGARPRRRSIEFDPVAPRRRRLQRDRRDGQRSPVPRISLKRKIQRGCGAGPRLARAENSQQGG